ncbi:MAG TPA: WYL domain-containing protein [Acidimicrobiales bacterium]
MDRTERCLNLLATLQRAEIPMTLTELTSFDGYTGDKENRRVQFERDKRVLRGAGVMIEVADVPAPSGDQMVQAYVLGDTYLPDLDLDDDERLALGAALRAVRVGDDNGVDPGARLGAADPEDVSWLAQLPAADALEPMAAARQAAAAVRFSYNDRHRRFEPWSVFTREAYWYASGYDVDAGEPRTYRIDRIQGPVTDAGPGEHPRPQGFSSGNAMPDDPLLLGTGTAIVARVLVDADHAGRVVLARPDQIVEERADGAVVLELEVRHRDAFRSWLFGYLDHAEVLAPPELRDEVVAWLTQMLEAAS